MHSKRQILASVLAIAAMGNAVPARAEPTPIRQEQRRKNKSNGRGLLDHFDAHKFDVEAHARSKHNKAVDARNNARWRKRAENGSKRMQKKKALPAPRNRGCTDVRSLITAYQIHSANERAPFSAQHKAEFERRTKGRTQKGIAAEARQMARTRTHRTGRLSSNIGGYATNMVVHLANLQQRHHDALRHQDWANWEPTDSANIWHNTLFNVFMFSDETGDLFNTNIESLCFETKEDAERGLRGYIAYLGSEMSEEELNEMLCDIGRTMVTIEPAEINGEAEDETYALSAQIDAVCQHALYKKGDAGIPEQILDRNGDVVLDCCKKCGKAESELTGDNTNV